MLSPHTPPGTKIVCINAADCEGYLYEGVVYTLRKWVSPTAFCDDKIPGVELEEATTPPPSVVYENGRPVIYTNLAYHPRRFRVAVLPKVLTDLLIPEMV